MNVRVVVPIVGSTLVLFSGVRRAVVFREDGHRLHANLRMPT